MKKLFKTIIKIVIIAIILLAVLKACFGKDKKKVEPTQSQPQIVEKQEEKTPIEEEQKEVVEEVVEEPEPEVEVQEEPQEEVIDQNSIRPEFKKSMESYEAFFDEYVVFMNQFKNNSTDLSMLAKYADFLSKYEKAMSDMEAIDESELTQAEDKLFLDTQLRISNKLAQAAINY